MATQFSSESREEELSGVEKNAADLTDFLQPYHGQQVLVTETYETIVKSGNPREKDWIIHTLHRRLGTLTRTPTFKGGTLTIPTDFYIERGSESSDYHQDKLWRKKEGPIKINHKSLLNLNKRLPPSTREAKLEDLTRSLEVCAGERNIALYFTLNRHAFEEAQKKYEEKVLTEQELEKIGITEGVLDLRYVSALHMIDIEPPAFLKGRIDKEKRYIMESLVHNVHYISAERLKDSLLLGLHREAASIDFGNGITVDVPKYIKHLCEKNSVTLSE